MRAKEESRAFRFDRELHELLLNSGLDESLAREVRKDPLLDELSWPERWTWLAVLSLAAGSKHGLTFAGRTTIGRARSRVQARGSSDAAVKRHLQTLQRKGLILRFKELRPGEERWVKHVYVTVVILLDHSGFRRARSPQARELVHGWGSGRWASGRSAHFLGPILKKAEADRPIRRRICFQDLVPLDSDAAANVAVDQGPPTSVGHCARGVTHRKKKGPPDSQTQNRASAEVHRASAGVLLPPTRSGDLAGGYELPDTITAPGYPVPGLPPHRRPQGGTPEQPRPEGGGMGSLSIQERRVS